MLTALNDNRSIDKHLKQHRFIAYFSKVHHHGLLVVWKIRQGIKKEIAVERISGYVKLFYEINLSQHIDEEENFLLPLLSPNDILRRKAENEHLCLREILDRIFEANSNLSTVERFADMLEAHIRFEERELFRHLQDRVNLDMITISDDDKSNDQNKIDEMWIDNFWGTIPIK